MSATARVPSGNGDCCHVLPRSEVNQIPPSLRTDWPGPSELSKPDAQHCDAEGHESAVMNCRGDDRAGVHDWPPSAVMSSELVIPVLLSLAGAEELAEQSESLAHDSPVSGPAVGGSDAVFQVEPPSALYRAMPGRFPGLPAGEFSLPTATHIDEPTHFTPNGTKSGGRLVAVHVLPLSFVE